MSQSSTTKASNFVLVGLNYRYYFEFSTSKVDLVNEQRIVIISERHTLTAPSDYLFKLVIVGSSGVGKSSLLMRFSDDTFNDTYLATIGVDFKFKTVNLENRKVKMQIWDTAGQERFRTITSAYYKGADAIIMVYDCTNPTSFEDIENFWINEVESYADGDVDLLLLGNKCDLTDEKQIDEKTGRNYAEKKKMEFFEVSAKTSTSVHEAFNTAAKKLIEKRRSKMREKMGKSVSNSSIAAGSNDNTPTAVSDQDKNKIKLGSHGMEEDEPGFFEKLKMNNCCQ